jgi:hypothetical protein
MEIITNGNNSQIIALSIFISKRIKISYWIMIYMIIKVLSDFENSDKEWTRFL